ncbi:MAG: BMC domain-containing protein [Oscillospiraceae bacterium]|nr:BMC domain-containing protein [Oscillospiraceae bacterium]
MGDRMTREEFLEKIYARTYSELKEDRLRLVCVKVPGKEISLAQLIGVSETRIYQNLGLHIGTHLGEDHTGESIGLLHLTPADAAVVAADVATKNGHIELGFLDRFSGTVILLGRRAHVRSALEGVIDFFRYELNFTVCGITEE